MSVPDFQFKPSLSWTESGSEAANSRDDAQWQWSTRYCQGSARQHLNSDQGVKKNSLTLNLSIRSYFRQLQPEQVEVVFEKVEVEPEPKFEESELDEMWSYVGKKTNPRWLWHAIDRRTGQVLAYVFGRRKDKVFLQLKGLLQPFGIKRFCTDGWGAYQRHLPAQMHEVNKRKTQKIERKHLQLRTRIKRLARKTICFSKSEEMHDARDWAIH